MSHLRKRVEKLEALKGNHVAAIMMLPGETEDQAAARHYETHPQDREAALTILVEASQDEQSGVAVVSMPDSDALLIVNTKGQDNDHQRQVD